MAFKSFSVERSDQLQDWGLLALRLGAGLGLVSLHGWIKLVAATAYVLHGAEWKFVDAVAALGFPLPGVFAVAAAAAESIGSILLALGLFTRISAVFVAFTMVVAVYRHLSAGQSAELAALYFLPTFGLALMGAGRYSLDALWGNSFKAVSAGTKEATA